MIGNNEEKTVKHGLSKNVISNLLKYCKSTDVEYARELLENAGLSATKDGDRYKLELIFPDNNVYKIGYFKLSLAE